MVSSAVKFVHASAATTFRAQASSTLKNDAQSAVGMAIAMILSVVILGPFATETHVIELPDRHRHAATTYATARNVPPFTSTVAVSRYSRSRSSEIFLPSY